jgi:RNA-directed DNA polymerase
MLETLEAGIKGGHWFSLIDKVYQPANLWRSWERIKANGGAAGVDQETVKMFARHEEVNLEKLAQDLRTGRYQPEAVRRKWIDKPGSRQKRPLGIPTLRDRVVQAAVRHVLEPIFERDFAEHSYGFRPNRDCKDALRRVESLLHQGYTWVVDADLKSYFDTIPHKNLLALVEHKVSDGRMLELLEKFLRQGVLEEGRMWTPEAGTPQGGVISPLLSNIYLDPLDHRVAERGEEMVRYADDFVILCRNQEEASEALNLVEEWTRSVGLQLHAEKTKIVDATQPGGFDFLGYHFERGKKWPRRKSLNQFRDKVRLRTRRQNGNSLAFIIAQLNPLLRGWFNYFQHGHRATFSTLDGWIRMRLRSILRQRQGKRGRGRGDDHKLWPNAFFAEQRLFSFCTARALALQSLHKANH